MSRHVERDFATVCDLRSSCAHKALCPCLKNGPVQTQEVKGFQIGHHASNKDCLLLYFCDIEQPRGNSSVGAAVLYIIQQLPYFQFVRRQTSDSGQVSRESQVISLRGS